MSKLNWKDLSKSKPKDDCLCVVRCNIEIKVNNTENVKCKSLYLGIARWQSYSEKFYVYPEEFVEIDGIKKIKSVLGVIDYIEIPNEDVCVEV